jgi:hypothetical protein
MLCWTRESSAEPSEWTTTRWQRTQRPARSPRFWTAKHASLFEKALAEEKQTEEKLSDLANEVNSQANEEGPDEQYDSRPAGKKKREQALSRRNYGDPFFDKTKTTKTNRRKCRCTTT